MRIVIVNCVFPPEPVVSARLGFDLANELVSKGNNVTVLRPKPSRPQGFNFSEEEESELFNTITLDSYICPSSKILGRFRESRSFGEATKKYLQEHAKDIDIVYINTWPLMAQQITLKACDKLDIPSVLHVQDVYPESLANKFVQPLRSIVNRLIVPLDSYNLRRATKVVAISSKMKNHLSKTRQIDTGKIEVVLNWQDEREFLNNTQIKHSNDFVFMYLGNIGPVAGVELLIKAFAKANISNAQLCIAGNGSKKAELINEANKYKYLNIEFIEVPEGAVAKTQAMADVLLLPIKKGAGSSSIPSKLPAYMFSAKPIIVCADEGSDVALAVKEAECGLVSEPENESLLADLMREFSRITLEDRHSFGIKGREFALKNYSRKEGVRRLSEIILSAKKESN